MAWTCVGHRADLPEEWPELIRRAGLRPVPLGEAGGPSDGSDPAEVEVLLSARMTAPVVEAQLAALPGLRWVHVSSAGVDWLDLGGLAGRSIVLTCGRGLYDVAIAEHVVASMLAHAKHVHARREHQRERLWDQPESNDTLAWSCVGLVGFGSIAREVARLAKAMRMRVEAVRRRKSNERLENVDKVHLADGLTRMLKVADHVVLAAPLTSATRGLVGAAELGAMKPTASLVNIARGGLLDEPALLAALDAGRPAAAYLDVFAEEPLPAGHPFWTHPKVVVTPHSSWEDPRLRERQRDLAGKNLERWARAEGDPRRARLINVVDLAAGY